MSLAPQLGVLDLTRIQQFYNSNSVLAQLGVVRVAEERVGEAGSSASC
ncbi:hypothetical protein [Sodalis sp.]